MPTFEFQALIKAGYSEAYLRTPLGSHTKLRRHYLLGTSKPRKCRHCGDLYALPKEIPGPVVNTAGQDLRTMFHGLAQENGFCSCKCEAAGKAAQTGDLFGGGE